MKIKVSDFISEFLNKNGIDTLFTITGGFSMHLNDSFGRHGKYKIIYQHHEQACGYAATGYSKTNSKPSIVCTTAGCAATNTITPCLIAHQDSLPVLFISGQVKSFESIRTINNNTMKLRHYAGSDCDIISMVMPITKYAYEITKLEEIEDVFVKAYKTLISGRPGPVWISIPVDLQGFFIDIDEIPLISMSYSDNIEIDNEVLTRVNELIMRSERPLIIAGNGIKLGKCVDKFKTFINKYNIPVVVTILASDVINSDDKLYCGKIGLIGDRSGNFTLQNCDLLISLGCRMSQGIIGYKPDWFARDAKIVYIDNDINEINKQNLNYALKIQMNLNDFFDNYNFNININNNINWIQKCNHWKNKWLFETPDLTDSNGINPYYALKTFYKNAPKNKITLCSSGSIVTNAWHMLNVKEGDMFIHSSQGDMGFELPAAIGAQIAEPSKMIIPILGEGSFQLNIQELQTIIQYKLPIKILLFNNGSHGATELTQKKFFNNKFGVDCDTGISFPDTSKISNAYGIKYMVARKNEDIESAISNFINCKEAVILEIFCCIQGRYPIISAKNNDDGTFTNRPFEDMDPFLSREEFEREMIVNIV